MNVGPVRPEVCVDAHVFDEWFARTYPQPQPPGTRETALIAWNAAVHEACDLLSIAKDYFVQACKYESAVVVRDPIPKLARLGRTAE